jgi:RND family efflux transporter MFP subunit
MTVTPNPLNSPSEEKASLKNVKSILIMVGVGLAIVLLVHFFLKHQQYQELVKRANTNATVYVQTTRINSQAPNIPLSLPGTVQGINESQIYSRANGFVKKWYKDIGQTVKKADLLAEIEIPEVEKQVEEANTNYELAKKAYLRWQALRDQDAVSQQELDEKTNSYRQTEAVLKRVKDQLQFREVRAPFDGIVSKRNINIGDLVNAGNTGAAQALFTISQNSQLKVYAYIPQNFSSKVSVGLPVEIILTEKPDKKISAKVSKIASAIDPTTRTMQVEILLPKDTGFLPGFYVQINFKLDSKGQTIIPTKTLLFSVNGNEVAVVKNGEVLRKRVILGNDYGQNVEVKSGIEADDELIINPPDSIENGLKVTVSPSQDEKNPKK